MASRSSLEFENLSEINVTPLVDVMMVLLVIFIITAPMLIQGLEVELPREESNPLPQSTLEPVMITITRDRLVLIGEEPVHPSLLPDKLAPLLAGGPRPVYIKGDRNVPYGVVMEVMAALNRLGVEEIGMITVPPEPS